MHLHPAKCISIGCRIRSLLLHDLAVDILLRKIDKLAVVDQFLHVFVHRIDIPANQLVNAPIRFLLVKSEEDVLISHHIIHVLQFIKKVDTYFDFQHISDTDICFFVFFHDLDHFYHILPYNPMNG